MKTIRWGIIGCGDVTEVKSGPGFYKADNSSLLAVMRRNGALARDYAQRHNVPRWHHDADAIITAPDIDAVYIATLPNSHKDYALRCAAAGKAVYVEKPMALNHAECAAMVDGCRRHGTPLFVAYYRRALPYFLKVKELIDEGAIGAVRHVATRQFQRLPDASAFAPGALPWRVDPALSGGGYFYEAVCHNFDILDFLFGPIREVHGVADNRAGLYPGEDTVSAAYRFESGVQGTGSWCFVADHDFERNDVVGATGRISFSCFSFEPIKLTRDGKTTEFPITNPPHVAQPLIQTIVDTLNGRGQCPSTGESAARTAWAMDRILAPFRARARAATS